MRELRPGQEADVPGEPLPAALATWVDHLAAPLLDLLEALAADGHGVWAVGGCVRDALRGGAVHDIDLAVTWSPEALLATIPGTIDTGSRFGTVTLRAGGRTYEATTLRSEDGHSDGRRPDTVRFSRSLSTDLSRRDLTVNALAVDVARRRLHDPFGGRADLAAGRLRAVGDPAARLQEDGLRVLRAYRFIDAGLAGRWSFEPTLAAALPEAAGRLAGVAGERCWQELRRILAGRHGGHILRRMDADGVTAAAIGAAIPDLQQATAHLDRLPHGAHLVRPASRLGLLLRAASAPVRDAVTERLRLSRADTSALTAAAGLGRRRPTDAAGLRWWRHLAGEHLTERLLLAQTLDPEGDLPVRLAALPPLQAGEAPLVDGHNLIRDGHAPAGRELGRLKTWLHRQQVRLDLPDADAVIALIEVAAANGFSDLPAGPTPPSQPNQA